MENYSLNELIEKYKLSKEEHNKVLESLKKDLFANNTITENPSVMFVIGQPGCGKTTFINSTDLSRYIIINSDDYRSFNKYSKEILDKYGIASKSQYITKEDYSIMSMVEFGMGISVLPGLVLHRCPYHIEIRGLLPTVYRSLAIAVKYNDILSPIAKEFLKHILNNIP